MSELAVGSLAGLAANSYEVGIASGSTLDLANAKAGSIPDTALSAVPGMKLVNTYTFSGATSHIFGTAVNPVFTSDYRNYKIIISELVGATSNQAINLRLTADEVPLTAGNYVYQSLNVDNASLSGTRAVPTYIELGAIGYSSNEASIYDITISNPAISAYTTLLSNGMYLSTGVGATIANRVGYVYNTLQYNGFQLYVSTHNFSGRVSIYGLEEA